MTRKLSKEATKEKLDLRLKKYNMLLDFCRETPRTKLEICIEFENEISRTMMQSMLTTLQKRNMLTYKRSPNTTKKVFEYSTVKDAVYFHQPYTFRKKSLGRPANGDQIMREGNVTKVTVGCYHTKGSSGKRSAWIASSLGGY